MSFFGQYGSVILFYLVIGLLIYVNHKKITFQGKIVAMYRTKVGIKLMERWGKKAEKFIKVLALVGVVIGFIGMLAGVYMIVDGLWKLLFVPSAPATFAPVIPGVKIPGVDIFVPFWYGIIALFFTIVVHEFSHGVVAEAYKMRVKHSGLVMFGPLPGAFVEPDEKQLLKASPKAQLSVYAAGPFSNILLTIILILLFGFLPLFVAASGHVPSEGLLKFTKYTSVMNSYELRNSFYEPTGLRIINVSHGSGADLAGLPDGAIITSINGFDLRENLSAFSDELIGFQNLTPNQTVIFANDSMTWTIITQPQEEDPAKGRIGIHFDQNFVSAISDEARDKYGERGIAFFEIIIQQVFWIILLSSGIGMANLLPLGPVDGGRMLLTALEHFFKKEKAKVIWTKVSLLVFVSVLILVFIPIIKNILF